MTFTDKIFLVALACFVSFLVGNFVGHLEGYWHGWRNRGREDES